MVWPYNTNVPLNRSCSALLLRISSSAFFYDAKVNKKSQFYYATCNYKENLI